MNRQSDFLRYVVCRKKNAKIYLEKIEKIFGCRVLRKGLKWKSFLFLF
jgi:hypothetical protein